MDLVDRQSNEHQPNIKKSRKDDSWWQLRRDVDIGSLGSDIGMPEIVDSDDEEDIPHVSTEMLSTSQRRRRAARLEKEALQQVAIRKAEEMNRSQDDQMIDLTVASQSASILDEVPAKGDSSPTQDRGIDVAQRAARRPMPAVKVAGRRLRLSRGITVDSGAADNVMPRRMLRGRNKIRPSPASQAGVHYVVANNGRIANEGEADFEFQTQDGKPLSWLFQIAEVNKTLAAVSALVDAGNKVVFDKDDETGLDISFITNKETGTSIKMRRERNVWVIDVYVR